MAKTKKEISQRAIDWKSCVEIFLLAEFYIFPFGTRRIFIFLHQNVSQFCTKMSSYFCSKHRFGLRPRFLLQDLHSSSSKQKFGQETISHWIWEIWKGHSTGIDFLFQLEVKGPSGPRLLAGGPSGLLTSSFAPFGRSGRVTHASVIG